MSRLPYAVLFAGLCGCVAPQSPRPVLAPAPTAPAAEVAPADEAHVAQPNTLGVHASADVEPSADVSAELEADVDSESEPTPRELPPAAALEPHPFENLSDDDLAAMLDTDPTALGALSLGRPSGGALFGGAQMQTSERWTVVNPRETWGTPETIAYLSRCIDAVNDQFPDTPVLPIGDISAERGGHLRPHISHQSGRDVDVAYYYSTPEVWYTRGTANNLDLPRTWAFVRAMVTEADVELIFIDRRIQSLLRDYATHIGEDDAWLDQLFGGPSTPLRPIIRHEPGHDTHIHVRFYNPIAQQSGRRMHRMLIARKLVKPPTYFVKHKVRSGDTLIRIARRYNTKVATIKRANRLRSNRIFAGRTYRIPRRGGVSAPRRPLVIPERRLPPHGPASPIADASDVQPVELTSSGVADSAGDGVAPAADSSALTAP